eukprot:gene65808-90040_t
MGGDCVAVDGCGRSWYDSGVALVSIVRTAAPTAELHMREASLFQQQLGCVTAQAFGPAVGLPHRRIVSLDTDGGMMFNL